MDGKFYNNGQPLPFGGEGRFTMDLLGIGEFGPMYDYKVDEVTGHVTLGPSATWGGHLSIPANYTFEFEGLFSNSEIPAEFYYPIHHHIFSAVKDRLWERLVVYYIVPELRPLFDKNFEVCANYYFMLNMKISQELWAAHVFKYD